MRTHRLLCLSVSLGVLGVASGTGPPAAGQVDYPEAKFSGYAAGSALHAEARVGPGEPAALKAEAGVSGASVNAGGLSDPITNEMGRMVQPPQASGVKSYSQGSGLKATVAGIDLGAGVPGMVLVDEAAEAAAPPAAVTSKQLGPLTVSPLAAVSLARGEARTAWSDETCVLGQPLSSGLGYVADVHLIELGPGGGRTFAQPLVATDAAIPTNRAVSQSRSIVYLTANDDGTFGVVSETRQTIAPVTVFKGAPQETTIEVLGELVLRARASGQPGGATIEYGPAGSESPTTPIVRLTQGGRVTELTIQQLFGPRGVIVQVSPLAALAVGEHPRRIADPGDPADPDASTETAGDGTTAAAAVDAVRLSLAPAGVEGPAALEVRIGHMEVRAEVPEGGVRCRVPIRKTVNTDFVDPGDAFTWSIGIPSSADALFGIACELDHIRAVDTAAATTGVGFSLLSGSHGGRVDGKTVTWDDLGSYRPGDPPIVVTVTGRVDQDSQPGTLGNTVEVAAELAECDGGPSANGDRRLDLIPMEGVAVSGSFTLEGPKAGNRR